MPGTKRIQRTTSPSKLEGKKTKQQYGSGSLRLRGAVYWMRYYNRAGKRVEESTKETSRERAQTVLKDRIKTEYGIVTEKPKYTQTLSRSSDKVPSFTVADLLDIYMEKRRDKLRDKLRVEGASEEDIEKADLGADEYIVSASLKPFFKKILWTQFRTKDTVSYREYRRSKKAQNTPLTKAGNARGRKAIITHASIDRELRVLRAAIRKLWKEGDERVPHLINVHLENVDHVRTGFISPADFLTRFDPALNVPSRSHIRDLVIVLFVSGMRTSEALRLQWDHIDMTDPNPDLWNIMIVKSKNDEQREVPIFAGIMRDAFLRLRENRKMVSPGANNYIFNFKEQGLKSFRKSWKGAVKEADLPVKNLRPHDLRRSAAKNMRNAGISGPQIMAFMGHKSTSMLLRYNIIDANDLKIARDQMNAKSGEWGKFVIGDASPQNS